MTDREPEVSAGPRPGHNYVAAVCRNLLRDEGADPAGYDALIYSFAAGWNGPADRRLIRRHFLARLREARW